MTRARNIAGFSTITTTPSPVHVGPIGVLTATRIDGEFNQVDLGTRNITAAGIAVTNLQVSGITTGLNVSGIITAQNGINFNGTSTGLNVSGIGTIATLSVTGNATVGGVLTYEDVTRVDSVGVITAREQVHVGTGVSIAAGGLNVTAGISTFQQTNVTSLDVSAGLGIAEALFHLGDTNTRFAFPSADTITLDTAGSERLRINSSGDIGINNSSPSYKLVVNGDTGVYISASSNSTEGVLSIAGRNSGGSVSAISRLKSHPEGSGNQSHFAIETRNSSNNLVEALRITSSQKVGIGTDSPLNTLHLNGQTSGVGPILQMSNNTGDCRLFFGTHSTTADANAQGQIRYNVANNYLAAYTTGAERLRIDSAGSLLLGATASAMVGGGAVSLHQVETTTQNAISCVAHRGTGNASGSILILGKSRGTSAGSVTVVASGDELGALRFAGADGTDLQSRGGEINCEVDGTPGSNDMPGRLLFKTTADGAASPTTRLTINQAGNAQFTGIVTATEFVPTVTQFSHRNLIVNGACLIAQRGTSSSVVGYKTVDRFKMGAGGNDETPQQYQGDIASHETPYSYGFRKSYYVVNGNQTGGAGTSDYVEIQYKVEARDIALSGWNYTSSSSFITLSFWLKTNVSQNFYGFIYSADGTAQRYIFETGTVSANSWNKIVVTIPGGSNVQFDNDVNEGLIIKWIPFYGTDLTNNSGTTLNTWANYNGGARTPDYTSTWYTTNNSTFFLTGVQLEVGSQATPFEHRKYDEVLSQCKRYYQDWTSRQFFANKTSDSTYDGHITLGSFEFVPNMRANPTVKNSSGGGYEVYGRLAGGSNYFNGDNNEAAAVHPDHDTFPGRSFTLTGVWNWHAGYNDTIAARFNSVVFDAEL